MTLTIEAIYENGMLKPSQSLPLQEREKVLITVHAGAEVHEALDIVQRTYGLIGWKGGHEALERILAEAEEPEELP